ncbi:hypothetical protein [Rossellomorea sp. FM04394]|uniref:hypothetical protein n=1 Tax=Rossellomorea sp. FM04394 TaxID=3243076 RepID=UPI0035A6C2E7
MVLLRMLKLCHKKSIKGGEGNCVDSCGSTGVPRPRSAKLRRLGRTLAASGAVPLTIQHMLIAKAQADPYVKSNNLYEKNLVKRKII